MNKFVICCAAISHMRIRALVAAIPLAVLLAGCGEEPAADNRVRQSQSFRRLYASPFGSGNACTETAPCSLEGARQKVRAINGSMSGDIIVNLLGGTYSLTRTDVAFCNGGPTASQSSPYLCNFSNNVATPNYSIASAPKVVQAIKNASGIEPAYQDIKKRY